MNAVVVTSENSGEFYARKLGMDPPEPAAAPASETKPGEPAKESREPEQAAKPEPGTEAEQDSQHPDPEKRQKLNARFSELSKKVRDAEAKAAEERTARDLAEAAAAELRAKYEPPKSDEIGPKPARQQFANDDEFALALEQWAGEKAVRERDQKEAQQRVARQWSERQATIKAELPDYDAVIAKGSNLIISNEVRDAILESEYGPAILYHLADNPDFVRDLAKKSLTGALREIGKLEATKPWDSKKVPGTSAEPTRAAKPAAAATEISRAPAPITPLKGTNGATEPLVDSDGVFHGTAAQWRAAREAGKIK